MASKFDLAPNGVETVPGHYYCRQIPDAEISDSGQLGPHTIRKQMPDARGGQGSDARETAYATFKVHLITYHLHSDIHPPC